MDKEMNIDLAVLYFKKEANKTELDEFNFWLNASQTHREYYDNWAESWEATGNTYEYIQAETDKAWNFVSKQTVDKETEIYKQRRFTFSVLKVAAVLILIVSLGMVVLWLSKTDALSGENLMTYSSGNDTITVRLSDGTRICLNKYSILLAPRNFKKHERNVYLSGEAYFDVARDTTLPFKIFAKSTITEVLGTSFNLMAKTQQNITKLTLVKGKVALYKNGSDEGKLIILPGQQGIYNSTSGVFTKKTVTNLNALAWKTGKIQFNNAPLAEICKVLSGYYNTPIIYLNQSVPVETELFTGTFDHLPLEKALDIISLTLNIRISERTILS